MEPLLSWPSDDLVRLYEQVLYYVCRHDQTGEKHKKKTWETAIAVVEYKEIPGWVIVEVVTPYIYAEDERLRAIIENQLDLVEPDCPPGAQTFNFGAFRSVLNLKKSAPPLPLVRYMYEQSPRDALMTFMSLYLTTNRVEDRATTKQIVWAEHQISDVLWKQHSGFLTAGEIPQETKAEFVKLSEHPSWWVRLYAAAIGKIHPAFISPEVRERFLKDEHSLVRQFAASAAPSGRE